jgi:cyclohexanone monooxygenase
MSGQKPQSYYDAIKQRFDQERDVRLAYRPEGTAQFTSDFDGELNQYARDPFSEGKDAREPINDQVEVLFIGGGFSALLTSARLRDKGIESIRIVERGGDVGGTWYWNRYPGVACDVLSYDYLPLLDEMEYVPDRQYARGPEIYAHCQAIARRYGLYEKAVFGTTVTSTIWHEDEQLWHLRTDRGDHMRARFVICANGTLSKPKLPRISGMETFSGHSFHTSRWDYDYTGQSLEKLHDKVVGIIGTGATAVQVIPELGRTAKALFVFQRTPSSIDARDDGPTDPDWARSLEKGWQAKRREATIKNSELPLLQRVLEGQVPASRTSTDVDNVKRELSRMEQMSREERIRAQENANIDYMMGIHRRIDGIVKDKATADALKPWYMFMCKRPCFNDEYLPTFNRPNVTLVDTSGRKGVDRLTAKGIVANGIEYEVDCITFATGFELSSAYRHRMPFAVNGREGRSLFDLWAQGRRTLHGHSTHGVPNWFFIGNSQVGLSVNYTSMLDDQARLITYILEQMRERGAKVVEATAEGEAAWVREIREKAMGAREFLQDCTPGYFNNEGNARHAIATLTGDGYAPGVNAFNAIIAAWMERGHCEGLVFS